MRYALKWEVAFQAKACGRFFHGVCPILNRAKKCAQSGDCVAAAYRSLFELLRAKLCRLHSGGLPNERRIVTALCRAKSLLFVFTDPESLLLTQSKEKASGFLVPVYETPGRVVTLLLC